MDLAIEAEGLTKNFQGTAALSGVDLSVRSGTVFALLGPNGAGKTTAVRILATLLAADGGRATVGGYDIAREGHLVRQIIALTGQYAAVDEALTGTENLLMLGRLLGLSRRDARARAGVLLAQFGLTDAADRAAKTYSGGMRRRLDLAASLVGHPSILYLDEPTTGLDPRSRNELWQIVRDLIADGVTVLLTTQYLEEADQLADEIAVVDHGRVVATGTPENLKAQVGAQTLQLRPERAEHLDLVVSVLTDLTSGTPEIVEGVVSVPVSGSDVMPAAVRRLDEAGVPVAELTLRTSTLDEVFLTLTGHHAEPATAPDGDDAGKPVPVGAVTTSPDRSRSAL